MLFPVDRLGGSVAPPSLSKVKSIYTNLTAPFVETPIVVAEAVKYTDNAWHAVKVNFANEISAICERAGVYGQAVMDAFCHDQKLNILMAYLRQVLFSVDAYPA